MSSSISVKRCSNPNCMRKERIYLNGASKCELCGTALTVHKIEVPDEASQTLTTMLDLRRNVKSLLSSK
jgi:hypothetical protein